jgi:hypothetical protein
VDETQFLVYQELIQKRVSICVANSSSYVYIGSISSIPPIRSVYGIRKKRIEDLVLACGGNIVRLGLVVNQAEPGGRYLELVKIANWFPVIPITHESSFQLFITDENDAVKSVFAALRSTDQSHTCVAGGTIEKNLGLVLREIAVMSKKKTFNFGKLTSKALETFLNKCKLDALDSLRSLSVRRTIQTQDSFREGNDSD